jgi:hypothetical protein
MCILPINSSTHHTTQISQGPSKKANNGDLKCLSLPLQASPDYRERRLGPPAADAKDGPLKKV